MSIQIKKVSQWSINGVLLEISHVIKTLPGEKGALSCTIIREDKKKNLN